MFFPIGDDQIKNRGFALLSYSFILINVVVFFLYEFPIMQSGSDYIVDKLFRTYGAEPCKIIYGREIHTLITSIFMHGSIMHILGNMLFLWIFADNIELTIGKFRFFIFYFVGGFVATYSHAILVNDGVCAPLVGASGAIAAVMGAYMIMFSKSRVRIFVPFILSSFYIPSWVFLAFWGGQEIYTSVKGISLIKEVGDGVAHWAHAGGFVFGIVAGLNFRKYVSKLN